MGGNVWKKPEKITNVKANIVFEPSKESTQKSLKPEISCRARQVTSVEPNIAFTLF